MEIFMLESSFRKFEEKLMEIIFSPNATWTGSGHFMSAKEMYDICETVFINDYFIEMLNSYCLQRGAGLFTTRINGGYNVIVTGINIIYK